MILLHRTKVRVWVIKALVSGKLELCALGSRSVEKVTWRARHPGCRSLPPGALGC